MSIEENSRKLCIDIDILKKSIESLQVMLNEVIENECDPKVIAKARGYLPDWCSISYKR